MVQVGEGSSKQPRRRGGGPAQQQTQRDLEVAVFFDGTQNSMSHAEQRTDDGSSYSNAMSNVALLYRLYPRNDAATPATGPMRRRVYMRGIGVRRRGEDDMVGVVAGTGPEGVSARVHDACSRLRGLYTPSRHANLTVDVFGFSRGAAAARYFVNCINRGSFEQVQTGTEIVEGQRITLPRVTLPQATVRFVGLFDTVAAVADHARGDTFNDARNADVNVYLATGSAQNVVHLTAANEHRDGFALNSLFDASGAIPANFAQVPLPGAHSDIGGGYRGVGETLVPFEPHPRQSLGVTGAQTLAEYRRDFNTFRQMLRRENFVATNDDDLRQVSHQDGGVDFEHYIWMRHRVRNGMDKVALKIMHEQARMASVPFGGIPRAANYAIPSDLEPVFGRLRANAAPTAAELALIHNKYTHWSSHYGRVQGRRGHVFGDAMTGIAYPMIPAPNRQRIVHPNIPANAW
ncbi:MAG: DUF2235 domain-containing protein [Myxococcota bacterium]